MAPVPVVELRNLCKSYGPSLAVGPVSFAVTEGEFVSLLGPSGCGKTTTLRCIAGFERPTSGDILIDGSSALTLPPHLRGAGFVFQSYALFPHLTVFENVAFGLRLRSRPQSEIGRRVDEALNLVDLGDLGPRYPSELSGGQQQRVALARCLVLQPRILLLDEPLSNLDLKLRVLMRGEIKRLQRRVGITTIYVTHDRGEAMTMSDRIVVLDKGIVQQIGTPHELYETPRTVFVADFIGASNILAARVEAAHNDGAVTVRTGSLRLRSAQPLPPAGSNGEVLVLIRPERIGLIRQGEMREGLSNMFEASVSDIVYLGDDLQIRLQVDGETSLNASIKAGPVETELTTGRRIMAYVLPRDVRLLTP